VISVEGREKLRNALQGAFADPKAAHLAISQVDDAVVDDVAGILACMPQHGEVRALCQALSIDRKPPRALSEYCMADGKTYYFAHATHTRHTSEGQHEFTGDLPMVRITLPSLGPNYALDTTHAESIDTAIGMVYPGDRLLLCLEDAQKYVDDQEAGTTLSRVDLITPARYAGSRFGAIAVYLLYVGDKIAHYVLEAGMATGEPRVLYWGPDFKKPITRRSWYAPTMWSKDAHYYVGSLKLTPDMQDIDTLSVDVHPEKPTKASKPYVSVRVSYAKYAEGASPRVLSPALLTLEAACRVAAIAMARREQVPEMGILTPLFAQLGEARFAWSRLPNAGVR
jgi:hypothetical protein